MNSKYVLLIPALCTSLSSTPSYSTDTSNINPEVKKLINTKMPNTTRNEKILALDLFNKSVLANAAFKQDTCYSGDITQQNIRVTILDFVLAATKLDNEARTNIEGALRLAATGADEIKETAEKMADAGVEIAEFAYGMRAILAAKAVEYRCYNLASDQYVKILSTYRTWIGRINISKFVNDKLEELKYRRQAYP